MKDQSFFQQLVVSEINGKNAAIHAYDAMVWKVRSGFLVLVFAGWSIMIKSVLDTGISLEKIMPYIMIYSGFSILLALSAFFIDRNYARRKFRVIRDQDILMQLAASADFSALPKETEESLAKFLQISGDRVNDNYNSAPYRNEMMISTLIYAAPNSLILILLGYYFI